MCLILKFRKGVPFSLSGLRQVLGSCFSRKCNEWVLMKGDLGNFEEIN